MKLRIAAALTAVVPGVAFAQPAQTVAPPDPASLVLPSLDGSDPSVAREGWKYFHFHKAGVTYEQAYADFAECYRFMPSSSVTSGKLPMFVPGVERQGTRTAPNTNSYGLVGMAISAMLDGPLIRRSRQSRLRRCLEPRGYVRYPIPKESWQKLFDVTDESIALQAKAASLPKPNSQPVTE